MTVYKQMEVGCDGSDGDCEAEPGGRAATVAEARAIAKAHGWVHKSGKDYCPERADRRAASPASGKVLDLMAALERSLADARVKFWDCPTNHPQEPRRERIRWEGDVATCLDCGRTNQGGGDHGA